MAHRRCADNGRDHHRLVAPQERRHHVCAAPPALRLGRKSSRAMTLAVCLDLRGAARSVVCPPGPVTGLSLIGLMNKLWPTARIRRAAGPSCMVVGQPPTTAIPATAPQHPDFRGRVTCCPSPSPCRGTQTYVSHRARTWTTRAQSRVSAPASVVMTNSESKSPLLCSGYNGVSCRHDHCTHKLAAVRHEKL